MNKKELQEALKYDATMKLFSTLINNLVARGNKFTGKEWDLIERLKRELNFMHGAFKEHINSLPDNYEPVPKEIKLRELVEEISSSLEEQCKVIRMPEYPTVVYITKLLNSCYDKALLCVDNGLIDDIALTTNDMGGSYIKELYRMYLYKTKIIDDLEGDNNDSNKSF